MSRPSTESTLFLRTGDGVRISARYLPKDSDTAFVVGHGFSGSWRNPRARAIAGILHGRAALLAIDFRGHGGSTGVSTVGDLEVHDVQAAVEFLRERGHRRIAVVGFSMGAAVAVRHAGLFGGVAAVAAVSGPAHWYYRGTPRMRLLHLAVERRLGRAVSRLALRTRISAAGWRTVPAPPWELAGKISPAPLLVVHGTEDRFFPLRHAHALYAAAAEPKELWIEPGMGHAESAMTPALVGRLGDWLTDAVSNGAVPPGS
ncbi:alpha/beta hydrolase family protein [Stackebrandtia albiflava]|uniref:Alpha/beta hydrolase family protein n=1 Tax=Stackebrandtia albiflava TaxID=406432 RepID=A0A562VBA5_9ACTN|nr:alpha/beta fold hydrolase [Stackebrandtia albiflava]TWJ15156.1 alpha/beta hydrolase family protein [Stackebrandtia albiflava]